jgi:lysophospholipase L1-like esterase
VLAVFVGEILLSHSNLIDNPPGQFRRSLTRAFEHKPGFKGRDQFGHLIQINSYGMRDREFNVRKPPGVYRILVLGDSVAFGWGVSAQETFSKQLEKSLNEKKLSALHFEVLNTGTRGYNTYQELQLLKETGLVFQPDAVALAYVNNDAEPLEKQVGLIDPRYEWLIRAKDFIKEHSYLYAFFRKNLEVARHKVTPEKFSETYVDQFNPDNPGWKASYDSLKEIQHLSQERHFHFLLAVCPVLDHLLPGETYQKQYQKIHDQILRAAEEIGIDTLDLLAELRGQDPEKLKVMTNDSFHPSPYGHRLIAEAIERYLEKNYLPSAETGA